MRQNFGADVRASEEERLSPIADKHVTFTHAANKLGCMHVDYKSLVDHQAHSSESDMFTLAAPNLGLFSQQSVIAQLISGRFRLLGDHALELVRYVK